MDWSVHYPAYFPKDGENGEASAVAGAGEKQVEWADVGCGFGGLLMALAPQFPDTLMLGESLSTLNVLRPRLVDTGVSTRTTTGGCLLPSCTTART